MKIRELLLSDFLLWTYFFSKISQNFSLFYLWKSCAAKIWIGRIEG